jgi:hypothetical protein
MGFGGADYEEFGKKKLLRFVEYASTEVTSANRAIL